MSGSDSNETEARRWLRYAREDLDSASMLMAHADTPRNACQLAQQAAEKSLKAAFVLEGMDFPYIHDLDKLRNLLPAGWSVKETHPNLTWLTRHVIEARYPEVMPELNGADASRAVSVAGEICDAMDAEFERRGAA